MNAMLYPQNGDRIVAIDSVTSLHPMYRVNGLEANCCLAVANWARYAATFVAARLLPTAEKSRDL